MSSSNLVPTRITNVNGVSTTVYRRPVTQANSVTNVPAPTLSQTVEHIGDNRTVMINQAYELAAARDDDPESAVGNIQSLEGMLDDGMYSAVQQVVEHFDEIPPHVDLLTFGKTKVAEHCLELLVPDEFARKSLRDNYVRSFVQKISSKHLEGVELAIITACDRDQEQGGFGLVAEVERFISAGNTATLDSFGRNASIIPDDMGVDSYSRAYMAIRDFYRREELSMSDGIPTLSAHLRAYQQYEPLDVEKSMPRVVQGSYVSNYLLIRAVESYPDSVDAIMSYRRERQTNDFDGEDFFEYLEGGAMKDGVL